MNKDIKNELKALAKSYKLKKKEFNYLHQKILNQFEFKKSKVKYINFGNINPSKKSLSIYTNILNSDSELNRLYLELKEIFLSGSILIVNHINKKRIEISGYNLKELIDNPKKNYQEIESLILGLHNYKHIHIINNKVFFEIPARNYLKGHPNIKKNVDYWIQKLKIFF